MQPSLFTYQLAVTRIDALRNRPDRTRRVLKPTKGAHS